MATINPQKVLRTGDFVFNNETGLSGKLHYLQLKDKQMTFEAEVRDIDSVQFDDGDEILHLPIDKISLTKGDSK